MQASKVQEPAPFHCLKNKRGCRSWKNAPHTTQLQLQLCNETHRCSKRFEILSKNYRWKLKSCCRIILCWDQSQTDLQDDPKPLLGQKGSKSCAETQGRQDTAQNLGGQKDRSQFLKKMLRKTSQKRTDEQVNLMGRWKLHFSCYHTQNSGFRHKTVLPLGRWILLPPWKICRERAALIARFLLPLCTSPQDKSWFAFISPFTLSVFICRKIFRA